MQTLDRGVNFEVGGDWSQNKRNVWNSENASEEYTEKE